MQPAPADTLPLLDRVILALVAPGSVTEAERRALLWELVALRW